jgi:hypothetical protein
MRDPATARHDSAGTAGPIHRTGGPPVAGRASGGYSAAPAPAQSSRRLSLGAGDLPLLPTNTHDVAYAAQHEAARRASSTSQATTQGATSSRRLPDDDVLNGQDLMGQAYDDNMAVGVMCRRCLASESGTHRAASHPAVHSDGRQVRKSSATAYHDAWQRHCPVPVLGLSHFAGRRASCVDA